MTKLAALGKPRGSGELSRDVDALLPCAAAAQRDATDDDDAVALAPARLGLIACRCVHISPDLPIPWLSLAFHGLRWPSLAFAGLRWSSLTFGLVAWPSLAFADLRPDCMPPTAPRAARRRALRAATSSSTAQQALRAVTRGSTRREPRLGGWAGAGRAADALEVGARAVATPRALSRSR